MAERAPLIDNRKDVDIARQVQDRMQQNGKQPLDLNRGFGAALVGIFSRYSELIIQRLNQAPYKNFLAFLDLLGASPLPPKPARVPLTFSLVAGSVVDGEVLAGTQVASPAVGDAGPAIFETEQNLIVTSAQLTSLFVRDPQQDTYADLSSLLALPATTQNTTWGGAPIFQGDRPIDHILYIGHSQLLSYPNIATLALEFTTQDQDNDLNEDPDEENWEVAWEFWNEESGVWEAADDIATNFVQQPVADFAELDAIPLQTINGIESRWLRCRLQTPITPAKEPRAGMVRAGRLPVVTALTMQVETAAMPVEIGFANQLPLDLSKDFYPFGEQPKFGDTFYLTHQAFSATNSTITLHVEPTDSMSAGIPPAQAFDGLTLQWEYWNGAIWKQVGVSTVAGGTSAGGSTFTDGTKAFTAAINEDMAAAFPDPPMQTTVNGVLGYWIRARIIAGNYGKDARYELVSAPILLFQIDLERFQEELEGLNQGNFPEPFRAEFRRLGGIVIGERPLVVRAEGSQWLLVDGGKVYQLQENSGQLEVYLRSEGYQLVPANLAPPSIRRMSVSLSSAPQPPEQILTYNDFVFAAPAPQTATEGFIPFTPTVDSKTVEADSAPRGPLLYLGFSLPPGRTSFPNRALSLYCRLADVIYDESLEPAFAGDTIPADAQLRLSWEYSLRARLGETSNGQGEANGSAESAMDWSGLRVEDGAENFTRTGLLGFLAPADFAPQTQFGETRYWLRVRWDGGFYETTPRLLRMLLNTTMAVQTETIRNEILGSSDGSAGQRFRTSRAPILNGQQLEVLEPEVPPANERLQLQSEEGEDAIPSVTGEGSEDNGLALREVWVRWHEVSDFYASKPRDRHYMLDHLSGEVRFGDSISGLIPPIGTGNIRMARYQTGGGVAGNKAANTIVQLKTTVPYVDRVTNPEPANGGAEAESLDSLIERAPRSIRHRDRAVTRDDYEDLAKLASPEVARALCVPLANLQRNPEGKEPGTVSVIIVPRSGAPNPMPSLELIRTVREHLQANSWPNINVVVVGPKYVEIVVKAELALSSLTGSSQVALNVEQKLARFLHPLSGGHDQRGWEFGRYPHRSDLYALLEATPGVDHIRSLELQLMEDVPQTGGRFLIYSAGNHQIQLTY